MSGACAYHLPYLHHHLQAFTTNPNPRNVPNNNLLCVFACLQLCIILCVRCARVQAKRVKKYALALARVALALCVFVCVRVSVFVCCLHACTPNKTHTKDRRKGYTEHGPSHTTSQQQQHAFVRFHPPTTGNSLPVPRSASSPFYRYTYIYFILTVFIVRTFAKCVVRLCCCGCCVVGGHVIKPKNIR